MSNTRSADNAPQVIARSAAPADVQVETTSPPPAPLPRPSCPLSLPPLPVSPVDETLSTLTAFAPDPPRGIALAPREPAPIAPVPAPLRLEMPTRAPALVEQPAEPIRETLDALLQGNPSIQACAVVSLDGVMIANALPESSSDARVADITAVLTGLAERAAALLGRGALEQVFLKGKHGYALIAEASSDTILLVLAPASASLGLFFRDSQSAATQLLAAA